jgi:hypothetical protein
MDAIEIFASGDDFPDRSPLLYELVTHKVKSLLRKDQLEEAAQLLCETVLELRLRHSEFEVLSVQNQLAQLEKQQNLGIVTVKDYLIERRKIFSTLYNLVKKI